MKRILGIGNALVDVMTILENDDILKEFNLPKGSMQLVDIEKSEGIKAATASLPRKLSSGGSAANTIHGLAMLDIDTGFIGSIGRDDIGDFFEHDMKKAGVNTLLIRRNMVTGTAVALISGDSERTFATHLGAAIELKASDLKPMLFDGYDILYLEGYLINDFEFIETACQYAKEKGMKIALDLASFNVVEAHLEEITKIVEKYVDILFSNEQEALKFTGHDPVKALPVLGGLSEIAILKIGAEGSWIKTGDDVMKINPLPVNCIDTTGAGDLYASGFLYGLAHGFSIETCGAIGSLMAGKVIELLGARMDRERFLGIKKDIEELVENR